MVKEQHAPEVHREIALLNTDNEFNREINEEDIDFNIPGLPHSTVKQLHGASVRELIQKIEKVQGMLIILGRRHRPLHVRALLAKRNRGEQEICPIHNGSPFYS